MKLKKNGKHTLNKVEILNVGKHGIWLTVDDTEYFLNYQQYPWFKKAVLDEILNVDCYHDNHLHWPDLDIDLKLDILQNPNNYPLVSSR